MYITSISIFNYKSFNAPSEIKLTKGFNIIIGKNNVGKTALLEALELKLDHKPHRSLSTLPTQNSTPNPNSWVDVRVYVGEDELKEILLVPNNRFFIPLPNVDTEFARTIHFANDQLNSLMNLSTWFLARDHTFALRRWVTGGIRWKPSKRPSFGEYEDQEREGETLICATCDVQDDRRIVLSTNNVPEDQEVGVQVANALERRVYMFKAERYGLGACRVGTSRVLSSNGSNLAEVLNNLQGNIYQFRRYNELVRRVLPDVKQITVRNMHPDQVEVLVWSHDPESEREDLANPIAESGTGIGQVLAMLYVVLTSPLPQIIIIDEPQSFLHPGALRALIEILREYPEHQFIIATHSPTIITAAEPSTITMITREENESILKPINPGDTKGLQSFLAEIGARLSDVFGADRVLWVEGQTEENCFPRILKELANRPLAGTIVRGVVATADLVRRDKRKAKLAFEIYDRLTSANSIMPPAVAFIFDRERLTPDEQADLRRRSQNLISFLPRRMFENYLLNPEAIAAIVNNTDGFSDAEISVDTVQRLIDQKRLEAAYYDPLPVDTTNWLNVIHGEKVLSSIFSELSETRVKFEKTTHCELLTEWIIDNSPDQLTEVVDLLKSVLDREVPDAAPPGSGG